MKLDLRGHVFESGCDVVEVTSNRRPDTAWLVIDAHGHEHRWHAQGSDKPADDYDPQQAYEVPTLVWVKDGEEYWEDDDEPHEVGHMECRACGEHISPGHTADAFRRYVPGLRWCTIDGEHVTPEEFERRYKEAYGL